jgi:predicted enzyme related to lactoylglutathione lyase
LGQPVVHFEITGGDPAELRSFYGDLFGWEFDTSAPVADAISESGNYGFIHRYTTDDGTGIPGGVGGGAGYEGHAIFYVGVPNVEVALRRAESLGGRRRMGPRRPFDRPSGAKISLRHRGKVPKPATPARWHEHARANVF